MNGLTLIYRVQSHLSFLRRTVVDRPLEIPLRCFMDNREDILRSHKDFQIKLGVTMHVFNPSSQVAETEAWHGQRR